MRWMLVCLISWHTQLLYAEAQTDLNTVKAHNSNTPCLSKEWSRRGKNEIKNIKVKWHYRSNGPKIHLQNIPPNTAEHIFFIGALGTFYKLGFAFDLKKILTNAKHEITSCILSNHNGIILEINKRMRTNWCRLSSTLLSDERSSNTSGGKCKMPGQEEMKTQCIRTRGRQWKLVYGVST